MATLITVPPSQVPADDPCYVCFCAKEKDDETPFVGHMVKDHLGGNPKISHLAHRACFHRWAKSHVVQDLRRKGQTPCGVCKQPIQTSRLPSFPNRCKPSVNMVALKATLITAIVMIWLSVLADYAKPEPCYCT